MQRLGLPLSSEAVKSSYSNNTMIIQYEKPRALLEHEGKVRNELKKMKASKDGDVDSCTVS